MTKHLGIEHFSDAAREILVKCGQQLQSIEFKWVSEEGREEKREVAANRDELKQALQDFALLSTIDVSKGRHTVQVADGP
jgi:hypothetical protein